MYLQVKSFMQRLANKISLLTSYVEACKFISMQSVHSSNKVIVTKVPRQLELTNFGLTVQA